MTPLERAKLETLKAVVDIAAAVPLLLLLGLVALLSTCERAS